MREVRTPTYLWVEAEVRRLMSQGYGVYVAARGDKTTGTVIQKISNLSGQCKLMGQQRDIDGNLCWVNLLSDMPSELEADAYIEKSRKRDPDIWVVEIEDKSLTAQINYLNE